MKKNFQPIIDYVEGRMSIVEFQRLFYTSRELRNTLNRRVCKWYTYLSKYGFNLLKLFENHYDYKNKSWNTIGNKVGIQLFLMLFLEDFNIEYQKYTKYEEDHEFLISIQPSWLNTDSDILDFIVHEMPQGLSKSKRIALGKQRVKELFRYDKTYPRWIQGAEWPIVNGKPLVFSHQERDKTIGDDITKYYFYDPDTNEQVIVEQFS